MSWITADHDLPYSLRIKTPLTSDQGANGNMLDPSKLKVSFAPQQLIVPSRPSDSKKADDTTDFVRIDVQQPRRDDCSGLSARQTQLPKPVLAASGETVVEIRTIKEEMAPSYARTIEIVGWCVPAGYMLTFVSFGGVAFFRPELSVNCCLSLSPVFVMIAIAHSLSMNLRIGGFMILCSVFLPTACWMNNARVQQAFMVVFGIIGVIGTRHATTHQYVNSLLILGMCVISAVNQSIPLGADLLNPVVVTLMLFSVVCTISAVSTLNHTYIIRRYLT